MAEEEINYFEHLNELRDRLVWVVVAVAALSLGCFFWSEQLIEIVTTPIRNSTPELYFMTPYEAFLMRIKVAVTSGVVLAAPLIFALLWSFVAPGLYGREKRAVIPITCVSVFLFCLGVTFAYFFVIPWALKFFLGFQTESLKPLISVGSYVSFFLSLTLVFGCVFVMPVVLVGLIFFGVLSTSFLIKQRKAVVVIMFILAAVLTPTMDIVTQCLMALPLWGLFEISIMIGKWMDSRRRKRILDTKDK